ncbi:MAG TPA: glycoside hydrolase family 2 protein [Hanamia sp.]
MNAANLNVKIVKSEKGKTETSWTFQVTNTTNKIAFFINPQIIKEGKEVLPSFWSDNYFSLSPNKSTTVTVSIPNATIKEKKPELALSGWNVEKKIISLEAK